MLNKNEDSDLGNGEKVLLEIPVRLGSSIGNYLIKDLSIPKEALLVSINRKGKEIIPNGTTELIPGDFMVVLTEDYHVPKIMDYFNKKS
ncbi:potassium transporter peripheral membrane component [compost metagenome]